MIDRNEFNRQELKKLIKLADMGVVKSVGNEFTNLVMKNKVRVKVTFTVELEGRRNLTELFHEINENV